MSAPTKVAIVTGAGTGIGKSAALALLQEGYAVALAGRRLEPLEMTAKAAGAASGQTLVVPTDVGDPDSVRALFARTRDLWPPGRAVQQCGGGAPIPLGRSTHEQWQAVVNANLTGAFLCTQEAFKISEESDAYGDELSITALSRHMPRAPTRHPIPPPHGITASPNRPLDGRKYNIACGKLTLVTLKPR
jgi:NAD(P)-dependent dehydrogenase (short-subunit alcohol dehydrogenase family)